jgi:putative membrane protein
MRKMQWVSAGFCAALMLSGSVAFADGSPPPTAAAPQSDHEFLVRALGVNQLELVLGQLAAKKGNSPEVRAMGEKMVRKHTEFGRQLSDLAQLPAGSAAPALSAAQQSTYARLTSLSGNEFDKSFKETVDAGHVQELAMYRDEAIHAADQRLRALAQGRVTTLQQTVAKPAPATKPAAKNDEW